MSKFRFVLGIILLIIRLFTNIRTHTHTHTYMPVCVFALL